MSVFEQLQAAIAGALKVSPTVITETTEPQDVSAWDSLGHLQVMMAVEQTFDLMLEVEDFARLNTVPVILQYLKEHGNGS